MIVDFFPFFNELDLLELRLHELSDVVDVFVLSEATLTFTGNPKPLWFAENKDRFEPFLDRIEHVVVDTYPGVDMQDVWAVEHHQKQYGIDVMQDRLSPGPNDVVLMSDADEICKAERIKEAVKQPWKVAEPLMPMFYYWMNCRQVGAPWHLAKWIRPTGRIMHTQVRNGGHDATFENAGWHFAYLGDIQLKVASWSHQNWNIAPYNTPEHIAACKANGTDLFNRHTRYTYEFLDDLSYLPQYVLDNPRLFAQHIRTTPASESTT